VSHFVVQTGLELPRLALNSGFSWFPSGVQGLQSCSTMPSFDDHSKSDIEKKVIAVFFTFHGPSCHTPRGSQNHCLKNTMETHRTLNSKATAS
jgi:hypothetical protein